MPLNGVPACFNKTFSRRKKKKKEKKKRGTNLAIENLVDRKQVVLCVHALVQIGAVSIIVVRRREDVFAKVELAIGAGVAIHRCGHVCFDLDSTVRYCAQWGRFNTLDMGV